MLMIKPSAFLAALLASLAAAATPTASELEPAPGWASQAGGTTGGAKAAAIDIYTVANRAQLVAALAVARPKIIRVQGLIDASEGRPFINHTDQRVRGQIDVSANTTLIGLGANAKLINGWFYLKRVNNVILRNITIQNPCDVLPVWDPSDGASGNWNSEWDGMTIESSSRIWVDHMTFTDGDLTDDLLPIENGKPKQCHDGALDIKKASDYVTVSNTVFENHSKNNLIGSSDSNTGDNGHQTITFNNNLFRHIGQRAPRVRFAMLHSYNNLFTGSKAHPVYPHSYSIGVGYLAKIHSQNNVFNIAGAASCIDVIRNPASLKGDMLDSGSSINGQTLDPTQCLNTGSMGNNVTWTIPYSYSLLPTAQVAKKVTVNAGAGRMAPPANISK